MPPRKHMRDACKVGSFTESTEGPNPIEEWVYGSEVRCRFVRGSTREVIDGVEVAHSDVMIHLPAGTDVSNTTRVQLTKRNNDTLITPEYFAVKGEPHYTRGNRSIVLKCTTIPAGAV